MRRLMVFACLLVLLAGCYHGIDALKTEGNIDGKVKINSNYQAVYRTIFDMSRRCLQNAALGAEIHIVGNLYTDIQKAVITQTSSGFGVLAHIGEIEIEALNDTMTQITVYRENNPYWTVAAPPPTIEDTERWVSGDKRCFAPNPDNGTPLVY
jgi:uncharacterized protein involved in high-affinity Fe2+ transport